MHGNVEDPVGRFKRDLAQLRSHVGRPPAAWFQTFGIPRSTLHDLLHGTHRPRWNTVRMFVDACRRFTQRPGGLHPPDPTVLDTDYWSKRYAELEERIPPAPQPAAVVSWPSRIGVVPTLASGFQHREVADQLEATRHGPRCHILSGLGGVGKTQLATEVAHGCWNDGTVDLLVWIVAKSRDQVVTQYAAALAGVTGTTDESEERAAERFLAWLSTTTRPWLIVLDNLVNPVDLRGLWPPVTATGRTIVTTRRTDAAMSGASREVVSVGEFTPDEAHNYVERKLRDRPTGSGGAAQLAADLGYLPLALAQAIAYLLDRDLSCDTYRERMAQARLVDVLPEDDALPDEQRESVAVTWSLSIELADALHPPGLARSTLDLASLLDSYGIPERFFTTAPAVDYLARHRPGHGVVGANDARDALRCLQRLHLLTLDPDDEGRVSVHALVQRTTRERVDHTRLADAARSAADALLALWPEAGRDRDREARLRPHAAALARNEPGALRRGRVHPLLTRWANSIGEAGGLRTAAETFMWLREGTDLDPDSPETLRLRHDESYWWGRAGELAVASGSVCDLEADCRRILGDDNPLTLTSRMYQARWWGMGKEYERAIEALTWLRDDFERVLGPNHPDTLSARNDLAHFRGRAGDAASAADAYEDLLADRQRLLGPDHPHTLLARNQLAYWVWQAGDPRRAVPMLATLVDDCDRVLGPGHEYTLGARGNLGRCRGAAGNRAAAVTALRAVCADLARTFGLQHPMTDAFLRYLADLEQDETDPRRSADQRRPIGHHRTLDAPRSQ